VRHRSTDGTYGTFATYGPAGRFFTQYARWFEATQRWFRRVRGLASIVLVLVLVVVLEGVVPRRFVSGQ
jgi:hypothetical protein